jgi:hypothetical protein
MKELKVGLLASFALAAGLIAAAAQSVPFYDSSALDYPLNGRFLSNPPKVLVVEGLPTPALLDLEPMLQGAIGTDGSGKIDGVQYARVYFGGASNRSNNYATFVINVTGKIQSGSTAPIVKLTMKGHGYDVDAQSDHPDASLNLTFNSSTGGSIVISRSQSVDVSTTNYTVTYLNGSPVLLTTNVPAPYSSYYVNPYNYAVTFLFTNGPASYINQSPYATLSGTLKGTITPGKKSAVNGGKSAKINQAAALFTESVVWTVVNDTNFVQASVGGSLVVKVLSNINAQIVQPVPGSKLYLTGGVGSTMDTYSGTGSANYNQATFKANLKGVGSGRGASLTISGTLGPLIVGYQPTANINYPTGYVTNRVLNAIKQISFSGKIVGQKIPLTSGTNPDVPFAP